MAKAGGLGGRGDGGVLSTGKSQNIVVMATMIAVMYGRLTVKWMVPEIPP
jgi:hypothetical protein